MKRKQTASQTVGPFFAIGLFDEMAQNVLVSPETRGERIRIAGQVLDGEGEPVTDALIEIWQADANGIYNHSKDPLFEKADPHFRGFGRAENPHQGRYLFETIKPGGRDGSAPYINVLVFARGMLLHAMTRIYFSDETGNEDDPVLQSVPADRRQTLIAKLQDDGWTYHFDVRLQGEQETVFFAP